MLVMNDMAEFVIVDEPRMMKLKPCSAERIRITREGPYGTATCRMCGMEYPKQASNQLYCSTSCKNRYKYYKNRRKK